MVMSALNLPSWNQSVPESEWRGHGSEPQPLLCGLHDRVRPRRHGGLEKSFGNSGAKWISATRVHESNWGWRFEMQGLGASGKT